MAARSVQISLDEDLLNAIDRRPETKRDGRSAVIKRALRLYLEQTQRESIDESYVRGYGRKAADEKAGRETEFDSMLSGQAWPDDKR
jgi:metal-responsive CopG/Arc/MetJ family transcriptional regulator